MPDWNALAQWLYDYCLDFCVNAANALGIDYVTFGSIFFGGVMNGVILTLVVLLALRRRTKYSGR